MRASFAWPAALAAALLVAGCGDDGITPTLAGGGASSSPAPPSAPGIEESGRPADPAAVRVIRGWTDAQRASDIDRATSYFAVPAVVENGTGPLRLPARAEVRAFNASLPCGAVLVRTSAATRRGFTVATFRLVNRPGRRCDGIGAQARTAFLVRGGRIRAWLRVPDRRGAAPGPAPSPLQPTPSQSAQSA